MSKFASSYNGQLIVNFIDWKYIPQWFWLALVVYNEQNWIFLCLETPISQKFKLIYIKYYVTKVLYINQNMSHYYFPIKIISE